ncbi:uncharacterized protein cubi_01894 [Cryptosporidium ubiquitum]|uniref:PHD-type domain-containing protein n=1 Tax=Cryptosporidium ubiquitum TaxID=857276 RepID=A0A1J4MR52_9CRYT|nr:uncharacterized protein cubi_01894 [Cryptosporidium ubiquitum]OII75373.1 hypothetical protein cubi_01894 [Cryptosporidium ubiquitum]
MELPSQLKKSNTCIIMNKSNDQTDTANVDKKGKPSINIGAEQVATVFEILLQDTTPKLSDFNKINLKKVKLEISKLDSHMLTQFCSMSEFSRNCESLLEEILDSDLIIEFGKKFSSNERGKNTENILIESLMSVVDTIGIFLHFELVLFNEIRFSKEIRILSNIIRSVLPTILSENIKNNRLEIFNASFIVCLETINEIVRTRSVHELFSTQIILGLLSIFLTEDSNTMIILLAVEIIVYLFVSGSLNSNEFLENSLNSIFNVMEELPRTNKAIKKARLCIDMDSNMHIYVYLLLRLVQSICIPNGIVLNDSISSIKSVSIKHYNLAKYICSQFATFFINNIILHRTKRKESNLSTTNDIATVILTDLLKASLSPKYNVCSTITQTIIVQLIKISNSSLINEGGQKSQSIHIDLYSKELCIHLLGISLSIIYKSVNIQLTCIDSSRKNIEEGISEKKEQNERNDGINEAIVDCICGNSYKIDTHELLRCENCGRNFHLDCIRNGTYLEIYEQWKCDNCTINIIFNEINTNLGINGEEILQKDSELCVVLLIVLDYLYRKTAMTVSQTFNESISLDMPRLVTDSESSAVCSFILEIIAKLKLGNNNKQKNDKEKSQNKTNNVDKNLPQLNEKIGKLYTMLLTEWVSPITKVHSSLIAYSSKFPKLLEANTIRFWNGILAKELKNVANIMLHCLLSNIYNSKITLIRRISLNSLGQVISVKPNLLITNETVLNAIILSLKDKTPKIRERALAIIEKYFSDISFNEYCDCIKNGENLGNNFTRVKKLLLEQIFRTAYDISPLVRMASIKILKNLYHQDPSKLNIGIILLKRASAVEETQTIRRLIFDSFTSIWFHNSSKVNVHMAECLVKLINYSESNEFLQYINHEQKDSNCLMKGVISILQESQSIKSFEGLITRWSNILVDMFIQCDNIDPIEQEKMVSGENGLKSERSNDEDALKNNLSREFSEKKLQILKTAEVIGKVYPKSIKDMYLYIVVYLKDFRQFKSEVMIHICTVLSYILPHVEDLETESIEFDLLKITTNSRSPQLIRSSILCLCNLLMKGEKGFNEGNALSPLILDNIRILWEYKHKILNTEFNIDLKEVDQVRRSAWLLGCIFEFSSPNMVLAIVDNKIERAKVIQTEFGISWTVESLSGEKMPKSEFGEDLGHEYTIVESSSVVFDLLCDLYYTLDWNLNKGVLFPTLIQFLMNQKQYVKTVKFNNLIKCAIKGDKSFASEDTHVKHYIQDSENTNNNIANSNLCIICLQGILSLLKSYEIQALKENKIVQENDLESSKKGNTSEDKANQFHDEINQSEDMFLGNEDIFSTPNTNKRTSMQSEKNEIGSPVSYSSYSNMENISSIRTSIFGSTAHNTSSVSASQPIASNLELLLNLFQETTGFQKGRFSSQQKQLVSSLILCILEQLNKQGLVNPTSIIPQISGLLFSSNREVSFKSYQIISSLFERFPNLIINKYKEISVYGFVFCTSNFPGLLGVYHSKNDTENVSRSIFSNEIVEEKILLKNRSEVLETVLEFFAKIYSEKCRNKRVFRESIIRGCCRQLELLLSNDETEILLTKFKTHLKLEKKVLLVLYVEFISYILLAMPFLYESEILLILFFLGEICVNCSRSLSHDSEQILQIDSGQQHFCNAILATVCTTIQLILKEEYRISENQISNFNPYNSINKEKPKFSHQDSELNNGVIENSTNIISLGRSTIYESLQSLREKLHTIWEISESDDSEKKLIDYANEIIYFYTQTTCEKVSKPVKRKPTKRKSTKRNRNGEKEYSDASSSQSWSPSSRTNKSRK